MPKIDVTEMGNIFAIYKAMVDPFKEKTETLQARVKHLTAKVVEQRKTIKKNEEDILDLVRSYTELNEKYMSLVEVAEELGWVE